MIGITLEAFIIQFVIFLIGRNLPAYLIGGAFAVSMVLFQKLGRLLVIYGFDFLTILKNFVEFATSSLKISSLSAIEIAWALLGLYFVGGLFAGYIGYYVGKNALKLKGQQVGDFNFSPNKQKIFNKTEKAQYSLLLLIFNLSAIILSMYLLNSVNIFISTTFTGAYIAFVIYRYKKSLNRLKNLKFWIWFVLITLASSYFLANPSGDITTFRLEGLKQGLLLNLRAAMVVLGFVAVSTELKNPLIKSVMYKKGAASLYESLEIAFGVLPQIIAAIPKAKDFIKKPIFVLTSFVSASDIVLNQIIMSDYPKSKIIILSGEIQQGKTTLLSKILNSNQLDKFKIRGFLSNVQIENGERKGYNIESIADDLKINLCSTSENTERIKYGRFYFNRDAFSFGSDIIDKSTKANTDLLIIDEIGPLEMSGEGWSDSISKVVKLGIPMIWVVRRNLIEKAIRKWDIELEEIIDLSKVEDAESQLLVAVKKVLD
jgi:nucleoside-triphosphatase THEP1